MSTVLSYRAVDKAISRWKSQDEMETRNLGLSPWKLPKCWLLWGAEPRVTQEVVGKGSRGRWGGQK
jgi:hypothetical protein